MGGDRAQYGGGGADVELASHAHHALRFSQGGSLGAHVAGLRWLTTWGQTQFRFLHVHAPLSMVFTVVRGRPRDAALLAVFFAATIASVFTAVSVRVFDDVRDHHAPPPPVVCPRTSVS